MSTFDKIKKLARKLELKHFAQTGGVPLATPQPSQKQEGSTDELFFGVAAVNNATKSQFTNKISKEGGAVANYLTDYATKTQKSASFNLQITAEAGKGASWGFVCNPPAIKAQLWNLLDKEFQAIMGGQTMNARLIYANNVAKKADPKGFQGGSRAVGSFDVEM